MSSFQAGSPTRRATRAGQPMTGWITRPSMSGCSAAGCPGNCRNLIVTMGLTISRGGPNGLLPPESLVQIGPDRLGVLEADREAQQTARDPVALPAVAALHRRMHPAERRHVPDQGRRGLDGARGIVGDVE